MSLLLLMGGGGTPGIPADSDTGPDLMLADDAIASMAVNAGDTVAMVHLAGDIIAATSGSQARAACGLMLFDDTIMAAAHAGERRRADPNAGTLA